MAVIRDFDDPARASGNLDPLRSAAVCGFTLTNRDPEKLGSGRVHIWSDDAARAVLRNSDMRRYIEHLDEQGRLLIDRAGPRLGRACGYWFGVFPNVAGANRPPMAFTLNVLEEFGVVNPHVARRVYATQRTAAQRAADVKSMDKTAAEADRDDRRFEAGRPGFWDDLLGNAKELFSSASVLAVAAAVVVGFGVLRR